MVFTCSPPEMMRSNLLLSVLLTTISHEATLRDPLQPWLT
jgi:hypothetical protein